MGAEQSPNPTPRLELTPPGFRIAVAELLTMARPLAISDVERLEGLASRSRLNRQEQRDIARLIRRAGPRLSTACQRRLEALLRR